MTEHLIAVQDKDGREVAAWKGTAKVSEINVERDGDAVTIKVKGKVVAKGSVADGGPATFYRWNADDKLAEPIDSKALEAPEPEPAVEA
jgi:hypothetical protein